MSNWPIEKLKGKLNIKHGFPFKGEFFSEQKTEFIVLTPGNFYETGGFKRQLGKEKFYTGEFPEEYIHSKGDVIVAMTEQAAGLLGSCARVPESGLYLHNQRLGLIKTNPQYLLKDYVYYLFRTNTVREQIRLTSSGSKVKHTSPERIYDVKVPLPDVKKQQKIVDFLDIIEDKLELNNRINTELEAMAKTLYDYWFVQFDFPDANGKPYKTSGGKMVYNATLKREIPAGWAVNTLSQIANITMGQSPAGESYNENRIGMLFFQGSTDFGWLFPTPRQYTTSPARMAKKGDILLSVRAPVGDMNIANADCCIGRGLAALNSKSRSDGFLFYVMKYFKQVFDRRNSEGTTFGSMTKDDLHSLQVVCPEPGLLKRYDGIVSEYNKMIFTRSLENQDLIKLRDWLLPLLMNGQVTVK
ncbi:restriction endonuclease subunit S [Salmonella enterica subsp. enterica serovar Newport]|uniref:Restriction endonuclease subunit S n=1 Tax=Salmonella enterica subsp. enterica serovar Pensacola TaxID=34042 RepID=A0A602Z2Y3_SALET|nr:restriction endonuclease subunit S [Salmonella enterica subsp. enterica serovar Pensacola]EAV2403688.1 restriction endonuclease subunit S [Salmonella enterica]ECA0404690.1 restriction endonuclease subunit S [Salmonella enterica subsp. enterica serovar Newport]EDQ0313224.1 restriction endonuclease subunit S [Salmonella enterica subsp. enterica serovar Berta]EAZ4943081.1 restriction endonuclease subunit S [Salmonella enterica]